MRASARRPARVLAIVAVLAVAGCVLALRLEPSAATDTLVGRGDDSFQATEHYRERFGDYWKPAPLLERLAAEGRGWPALDS